MIKPAALAIAIAIAFSDRATKRTKLRGWPTLDKPRNEKSRRGNVP